jgi:hypothetical protein
VLGAGVLFGHDRPERDVLPVPPERGALGVGDQLTLDLDAARAPVYDRPGSGGPLGPAGAPEARTGPENAPGGQLRDRRAIWKAGGAPRLLRDLIRRGLDPAALDSAARLVAELEREARQR